MLPSQRALFDIPRDVCYLNAAAFGPLSNATRAAGEKGAALKARPWELHDWQNESKAKVERARRAAARLLGAEPDDVAVISSVSYGIAVAGRVLPVKAGERVLVLQDDHSSPVLEWLGRAKEQGFEVEAVARPEDGDWTRAVLAAIGRPGAAKLAVVSISSVHWSDGGLIDLERVAVAARGQGAALVVDATHHAGMLPVDVKRLDPDFLVFPTYKWVLGPYGRAFLYVAKRWQDGVPLEQTGSGRRSMDSTASPYMRDIHYVPNARRFDMGERDFFITLEMAAIGMELVAEWGTAAISERLSMLTGLLAEGLPNAGVTVSPAHLRAPHVLSLGFPEGMPKDLPARLAAEQVFVSPRLGRLRISPHVYNDEADVDRFVEVFRNAVG
ncbi:MAG TPA: aminotransferase class V-fold PLP-dependent enzyme [Acetobacteraceae bacterium]|jgi:selenocysteine lyase/cysteine desulfurase|nr:aminotransferase class V-fold PLP-dependent enzyme [Acetobacteraceae bacterium]